MTTSASLRRQGARIGRGRLGGEHRDGVGGSESAGVVVKEERAEDHIWHGSREDD
jgi:hypothetical protein